jgi:hypothetical protein
VRGAWLILLALSVAGCGEVEPAPEQDASAAAKTLPDPYANFERHWPGHVAVSDEYRIQASFPEDRPVCVSDTATHIHGFRQWRDGDCAEQIRSSGRFISVWADYNTMEFSWVEALALSCGTGSTAFDLGLQATGGGRLAACRASYFDQPDVITVVYLADLPEMELGDGAEGQSGGADVLYTIRFGATPETEEVDFAEFRDFLSRLQLAGSTFQEI